MEFQQEQESQQIVGPRLTMRRTNCPAGKCSNYNLDAFVTVCTTYKELGVSWPAKSCPNQKLTYDIQTPVNTMFG